MPLPGFVVQETSIGKLSFPAGFGVISLPKATPTGNIVYAIARSDAFTSGGHTISDVAGNTWVPVFLNHANSTLNNVVSIWRAVAVGEAAGNQVTMITPGSLNSSYFLMEILPLYSESLSAYTFGAAFTPYAADPNATTIDGTSLSIPLTVNSATMDLFQVTIITGGAFGYLIGAAAAFAQNTAQYIDQTQVGTLVVNTNLNPQIVLTGGNFQDALGRPLANGELIARLSQDVSISASNIQLVAGKTSRIPLDNNGGIAGFNALWATDKMTPANSTYSVRAMSSTGVLSWGPHSVSLPSANPIFDVSQWIPQ